MASFVTRPLWSDEWEMRCRPWVGKWAGAFSGSVNQAAESGRNTSSSMCWPEILLCWRAKPWQALNTSSWTVDPTGHPLCGLTRMELVLPVPVKIASAMEVAKMDSPGSELSMKACMIEVYPVCSLRPAESAPARLGRDL